MIKSQNAMSQLPKTMPRYRITASLLNSWQQIWDCADYVFESENDTLSYEDKLEEARQKKIKEFVDVLNRIPIPDNEYMKKGREYEALVCNGGDSIFSPIIEDGAFQVTLTRNVDIDDIPITLYGVLDVLKGGRIMDIKRVKTYKYPKYRESHQHSMYLYLYENAIDFTYLICDDKGEHHYENYIRENCEDILKVVSDFISWLKANDLIEIFKQKWQMKTKGRK